MGEFLQQVQSNSVSGPLRRSFTRERWERAFAASAAPDREDLRVYNAAIIIHTKLENIRSRLKLSSSQTLTATTKLRAFVAAANHNFRVAASKTIDALQQAEDDRVGLGLTELRPDEVIAQAKLELPGGFEWPPNEVFEGLVDGVEVPIRFSLQGNPSLEGNARMNEVAWSDIALELNLGIMFRHAEDLWDDCLWNGYRVIESGNMKAFLPENLDTKRGLAMGIARRNSLAMAHAVLAGRYHFTQMAEGALPRIAEVVAIEHQGKHQTIRVSRSAQQTEAQEQLHVLRSYANEPYYHELLEEKLPSLAGLTLSEVLDAWMVISRVALLLAEKLESREQEQVEKPDAPAHTWLPDFAPVIKNDALVQALLSAARIPLAHGKMLVEFFTFRGKAGQEIWAQPLVPVGRATSAPIFAAIISPNLRRLVDVWMRQLGIDLGKRGPAFEAHVRASARHSIATSAVLNGHAICIEDSYTFKPSGDRKEEIDLLFAIGDTVFIAECKCILEPTEAKDVAMHRKTVHGAAEQALRKSSALLDNRPEFVSDMQRYGIRLSSTFSVVPFIVVSTATHVGVPADGVPVVDEYILEKFLEGELEDIAVKGPELFIQERFKTVFYSTVQEAEARGLAYFQSPPQVQKLKDGITARLVPLHAIDQEDWEGVLIALECIPRQGPRTPSSDVSRSAA